MLISLLLFSINTRTKLVMSREIEDEYRMQK
jgi:hypothetical protein